MGSDSGISAGCSRRQLTTSSLASPSPETRRDSVSVTLLRPVTSISLFPAYRAQTVRDLETSRAKAFEGAHLEIKVKFPNYLSPGGTINGDRIDGEVSSLEGPLCGRLGCNHGYSERAPWILSMGVGRRLSIGRSAP